MTKQTTLRKQIYHDEESLWKLQLADAILEEAKFKKAKIEIGDKIEHQLGTIWLGQIVIRTDKVTVFMCIYCKGETSAIDTKYISSLKNWKCPKCNKLNKVN